MPETASILLSIGLFWAVSAIAPGPNFLITTRTALLRGRTDAMMVAVGLSVGSAMWGLAGFFGIHALFTMAPRLYFLLKLGGAAYIAAFGVRLLVDGFRGPSAAPAAVPTAARKLSFWRGCITSMANPYSALSAASVFAAALPPHPPLWLGLSAVAVMTGVAFAWYTLVACVLSLRRAAAAFLGMRRWIDGLAGAAFIGFGVKLAIER